MVIPKIASEKECIHIFAPGRSIDKTFISVYKKYRVDQVIVLLNKRSNKDNEGQNTDIIEAVKNLRKTASSFDIPVSTVAVDERDVGDIRDQILEVRDRFKNSVLYFNITGGKKVLSLYMFTMAVWINGSAYYVEQNGTIIEFSIPKIQPDNIEPDGGYFKVLKSVYSLSGGNVVPVSYSDAFAEFSKEYRPARKNNAGRYPVVRKGTFSRLVRTLIENGLVTEAYLEHSHKTKVLNLTPDGIFTVHFVEGAVSSESL